MSTTPFLAVQIPACTQHLTLTSVQGSEYISNLFDFQLIAFATNAQEINAQKLIGQPIAFQINDQTTRYFHGVIQNININFTKLYNTKAYHIRVRPWLWLLTNTKNCRVFQNKSTVKIIEEILQEFNFDNYDLSKVSGVGKNYLHEYCVQYNETYFNFIARLMEEAGILYYFEHSENQHRLILTDNSSTCKQYHDHITYQGNPNSNKQIFTWNRQYNFHTTKIAQTDYNFKTPTANLLTQAKQHNCITHNQYELFNYPGNYFDLTTGKTMTQSLLEEQIADVYWIKGSSNYIFFAPGNKFSLKQHEFPSETGDYLLLKVTHCAYDYTHAASETKDGLSQSYDNDFVGIPSGTLFRPKKITPKPLIYSSQTAAVVGAKNQEIYTDSFGRIKVQFFWDRRGKHDEHSSCWIRVAHVWSGKSFGVNFIPRIGNEVIINFLEGNPDRPIVTGCLHNNNHKPIYNLPANKTKSGIKTHSIKSTKTTAANEIYFEDKANQEEIYIHAQKDLNHVVENDQNTIVKQGNQVTQIENGISSLSAKQKIEFKVGGNSIVIDNDGVKINGNKVKINN